MLFPESFKSSLLSIKSDQPGTKIFALHHSRTRDNEPRKVLVLLHGYPQNHTLFHGLAGHLADLGVMKEWDIVVPDLSG
jgi:haloacetate dehalogenase